MNPTVQSYVVLVDFLEAVLGTNSEIVLHDFSDPDHSVVDIRNGAVSGRSAGAPATDFALKILNDPETYADRAWTNSYRSLGPDGKPLRSASFFIREEGSIVGMLCVNTDMSTVRELEELASRISGAYGLVPSGASATNSKPSVTGSDTSPAAPIDVESLTDSTGDLIAKNVAALAAERGSTPDALTQDGRIDIIRTLNANGMFLLKGAVASVAESMGISEPSVYRYLQKVRKK